LGGGVIDTNLLNAISGLPGNVFQTFGMTETATHIGLKKLNGTDKSEYFEVLPGIRISKDQRGCLSVSGPIVGNEILVTNDLVNIVDDQHFEWIGRIDNLINSGGIKVSPEQVEPVIKTIAAEMGLTKELIICGFPDRELGEKVCLLYEGTEILDFSRILTEKLKKVLPSYHTPKIIDVSKPFEYTRTGKINRKETVKKYLASKV
jgi:O-succinylbenzoic acid--CoA ligase